MALPTVRSPHAVFLVAAGDALGGFLSRALVFGRQALVMLLAPVVPLRPLPLPLVVSDCYLLAASPNGSWLMSRGKLTSNMMAPT